MIFFTQAERLVEKVFFGVQKLAFAIFGDRNVLVPNYFGFFNSP